MNARSILRLIRFPNLLIVALTQVVLGAILYDSIPFRTLTEWSFGLLVLTTVFIAASGYVINDIYDSDIDIINKPEKVIVGKKITIKNASYFYWGLVIIGFSIAIYLSFSIHDFKQLLIYPFAIFLLWAYAKKFKKSFIIGNLIVAAYCAFVPGIILYAERSGFYSLEQYSAESAALIGKTFLSYALMAFLTTAWREVVKDMEDVKGDKAHGAVTLPVKHGLIHARKVATGLGTITLVLIIYYVVFLFKSKIWFDFYYLIFVLILVIFILINTLRSLEVKALHLSSQLIKIVMIFGIGYLFLWG